MAPRDEGELMDRARALAGRTLGEVAAAAGVSLPPDQRRHKGAVGNLLERALGATAGTASAPDFESLGVELKTIPVRPDGRPAESTFVCTIPLEAIADMEWRRSPVHAKLARVLWVPVESRRGVPLAHRRVGTPLLWSPSPSQGRALEDDWMELAGLIGMGEVDRITGHLGRCLQVRPKAANGRARRRAMDAEGGFHRTLPRGFYLRATFTAQVLRDAL